MTRRLFVREVRIDWDTAPDSYVRSIPALRRSSTLTFTAPVTFFAGTNGAGKSTLLEAIAAAYGFNPEGGTRSYRFSTYDDVSDLADAITMVRDLPPTRSGMFLRAESFFTMATQAAEYGTFGLHEQSHGQGMMAFIRMFTGPGLYLMDEPESALSPQTQLELLIHIDELTKRGAQFIIATHSPILLGFPHATILSFDEDGIHTIGYEQTEAYRITELFINHRASLLHRLFQEDEVTDGHDADER